MACNLGLGGGGHHRCVVQPIVVLVLFELGAQAGKGEPKSVF